jgi:hypothetical protein
MHPTMINASPMTSSAMISLDGVPIHLDGVPIHKEAAIGQRRPAVLH